jgi:hypothetical protein
MPVLGVTVRPLRLSVRRDLGRLARADVPLALDLPRPLPGTGIGMGTPAPVLGAPVPPVPVMAPLTILAAAPLTVLPVAVRAMWLGMGIRPRRGCRLAPRVRAGRPARIGRRLPRLRVMAVR